MALISHKLLAIMSPDVWDKLQVVTTTDQALLVSVGFFVLAGGMLKAKSVERASLR